MLSHGSLTGDKSPLGTNTKSASAPPDDQDRRARRTRLYALQRAAAQALPRAERVCGCGQQRRSKDLPVSVKLNPTGSAYFGNVMRCGSVWMCSVCAAKITEERRIELDAALTYARGAGAHVYLVTLTVPHKSWQRARSLLLGVRAAARHFNSGRRAMKTVLERYGYIGQIRALEVTHGDNGWHPHLHVLVILDVPVDVSHLRRLLAPLWRHACIKSGLDMPSDAHGVTVQDGSKAAKYVGKWGLSHEMTKAHVKRGGRGGRTPWQLLELAAAGDLEAAALWAEFALAFKGARQLFWSRDLKALCGLLDVDDQVLADAEESPDDLVLLQLDGLTWSLVRRHGQRSKLLDAAERAGAAGARRYIERVRRDFLGRYAPQDTLEEAAEAAD